MNIIEEIPALRLDDLFEKRGNGNIDAMSTPKLRGIINHLAGLGNSYLEVGVFRGSTLVSAAHNNDHTTCIGIDNFSEFNKDGTNESVALERIKPYSNATIINGDCWEELQKLVEEMFFIDTYFFDGPHDYDSQLMGLEMVLPILSDDAYIIVDDINWKHVRQANEDFRWKYPEWKSIFKMVAPTDHRVEHCTDARHPVWWNGIEIMKKF